MVREVLVPGSGIWVQDPWLPGPGSSGSALRAWGAGRPTVSVQPLHVGPLHGHCWAAQAPCLRVGTALSLGLYFPICPRSSPWTSHSILTRTAHPNLLSLEAELSARVENVCLDAWMRHRTEETPGHLAERLRSPGTPCGQPPAAEISDPGRPRPS